MEKVLRSETTRIVVGWTATADKKGTINEFCDNAGYTVIAVVAETLRSLDIENQEYIKKELNQYY